MHSTAITCSQVGARCYPPFLGITNEMMSRGPQVAYMEYQEMDLLTVSTYADGDPLHHNNSLIHHDGIHHIDLLPEDNGFFSMRYNLGIVVNVTLIIEAFEYVALKLLLIIEHMHRNYAIGLISPW